MCLAVPGKLVETQQISESRLGVVQFGGIRRQVFLDFVPEAQVGDYVLVHVGFAISRLDEEEARRTYELLERIGMLEAADGASGEGLAPPQSPKSGGLDALHR